MVAGPSAHRIARALARGATSGARGNSGIILSQVLRGIADAVVDGPLTGPRLRVALRRAAMLVRTGLSAPVEGTILTVLDRAAVAADTADDSSLVTVAEAAADGAARALNETPAQLGVLRAAGVVDAGARGLLVLLDCLVTEVCGRVVARGSYARQRADIGAPPPVRFADDAPGGAADDAIGAVNRATGIVDPATDAVTATAERMTGIGVDSEPIGPRSLPERAPDPHFEVMYLISGTDEDAALALRDRLAVLGDSVVVVGDGEGTWSAHVHCRDAGAAIEAGLAVGSLSGVRIESFAVTAPHGGHHEEILSMPGADRAVTAAGGHPPDTGVPGGHPRAAVVSGGHAGELGNADRAAYRDAAVSPDIAGRSRAAAGSTAHSPDRTHPAPGPQAGTDDADRGILAVVSGDDAARLFADAGAVVLRGDRQFDTNALLRAIRAMPHREVLVLPNGALPAQELVAVGVAARDGSRDVLLLPSASMVQGLAALAVHDRGRIAVDDAFAMSEAAATTRWGALRAARVRALTMVGTCSPGDGLGLVGQDVVVIDPDVVGAGRILLDRMLGLGGELVTLLMGADAGPELARVLTDHVTAGFPGVEVVVYSGGQQADLVQIGVE
ncbi:DAK2 domain-containing protein [Nocardia sp. SSK8]|uniref:DAK2 domain-containing protein n=1 Tax=Nocardia sp. SSK8 TaxID=3120154 RepID=UPI003FA56B8B